MKKLFLKLTLIACCIINFSPFVFAQTKEAMGRIEQQRQAMKKLDFLIGTWRGGGWASFGPNQRITFTVTETVTSKLNGLVVMFEGLGKSQNAATGIETINHNALGLLSYDSEQNVYRWKTFTMHGYTVNTTAEITDQKFVWNYKNPAIGGDVRYTITLNDKGNWLETGEFSRDNGKTWLKNFEMELEKVK